MESIGSTLIIPEGTEIRSADDAKLGNAVTTNPEYVVVEKGFLFPTDYYIPTSAVTNYDGDKAYLSLTKDEVLHQGWDQQPGSVVTSTARMTQWAPTDEREYEPLLGKDVYSADGDKVGTIKRSMRPTATAGAAIGHYFFLLDPGSLRGWFGGYDQVYLPESAIDLVSGDRVDLNLTKEQIKSAGWTTKPANVAC